jgi:16S rRNA (guanine966-N2)-methyltransferase
MRVIAGVAGGIPLFVPKNGVRPTMDRVKGAIFSSLADKVIGARVLDLFAGSGALGIEALSRGAASAVFVEENRLAVAAIEKILTKTRLSGSVRQQEVFSFLRHPAVNERFDLIFADPPYEQTKTGAKFTDELLKEPGLSQLLQTDGIFVLEKRPGEDLPGVADWRITRDKTYGATEVLFLSPSRSPESTSE